MRTSLLRQFNPLPYIYRLFFNGRKDKTSVDIVLEKIKKINDPTVTKDFVSSLIFYLEGGTFFINDILFSGLRTRFKSLINPSEINRKEYLGLKDYIDLGKFEVDREPFPQKNYPKEKLRNNIALRWFDNLGHTSVLSPFQMLEIIEKLLRVNPILARSFTSDLMEQAFYGNKEGKSY